MKHVSTDSSEVHYNRITPIAEETITDIIPWHCLDKICLNKINCYQLTVPNELSSISHLVQTWKAV
jgi:hypothetical protein